MTAPTPLERIAPLVGIMAAERTKDRPDLYEDARQEGLIAVWKAAEADRARSTAYLSTVARRAVVDALRGRPAFGAPRHRGRQDAGTMTGLLEDLGPERAAEDPALAGAELSAIVREALRALPERERRYVWLRFWRGLTAAEIGAELGLARHTVDLLWSKSIRPRLREALYDATVTT